MTLYDLFPSAPRDLLDKIDAVKMDLPNKKIFIAQCAYESNNFTSLQENLDYSAQRLLEVFPKHFNKTNVISYANNPEKIANKIYANRMGNGNENSGDGYRYRGRGLLQITGKDNYSKFGKEPDFLLTSEGAIESAIWFWNNNHLNGKNILDSTKIINGGTNGLAQRMILLTKVAQIYK